MMDVSRRNAAILAALKQQTAELVRDPAKLAKWAEEQRQFAADYAAYMAQADHDGDCHCARCMSEFFENQAK